MIRVFVRLGNYTGSVRELHRTYFHLTWPDSERLHAEGGVERKVMRPCPITTKHCDGGRRVGELSISLKHNSRDEKIVWGLLDRIIHEQVLAGFEKQGFTGYRIKPATARFRDGKVSRDYQEFIVTGWAGAARPESGVRILVDCAACHYKRYSGITDVENLIDWDQWTGEDFFIVWPLPGIILITERVGRWLLSQNVKSFRLQGLEDRDPLVNRFGFTPGALSDFLPEDLAQKYGRPLGIE